MFVDTAKVSLKAGDGGNGAVCDAKHIAVEAVTLLLLADEVIGVNVHLFILCISGKLDDLHTVDQGTGHRVQRIGGSDEQAIRQVEG